MMKKKLLSCLKMVGILSAFQLLFAGCVSQKIEPEHKPKLGVAQSNDGWITMNLETKEGYIYSIYYECPKEKVYKPMKGCESIKGTGDVVEIRQKYNSRKPLPPLMVDYVKVVQ